MSYIDEQLGRVLDALDQGPHARNTILIFASDNGYNGGEKNMWAKYALWVQTCRVVLGISGPGLPPQRSATPVSLIDIYPTLLSLCGLPAPASHPLDGIDLAPVLQAQRRERGPPVLSTFGLGNHSITDGRYRYIRYRNGDEEFYDHTTDPHEWTNLAQDAKLHSAKAALARHLPTSDAPEIEPARPWDGSELNAEVFKKLTPTQTTLDR